ncbi:LytR/AlgR family response regulator transcription factor [Endozoicomonas ascidiicola]|uniref:LytR/AlgR family response regulator transcription factor n=1 Tax=Endozoicomonas ascidiicola TaxID=1698521 RepID=UPI000834DF9E|nr:LytTR family DNA-binding domain-containing protein [Endozoicomonas ascidiicola]
MNVLIVDDEPLARERLRHLIARIDNFMVLEHEASNGRDAIDLCTQLQPDIVLMDIRMPVMGGLEAAKYISNMERPPAIIFCTAYDSHALEAFDAQAVGYLLKPIRLEDLTMALQRASRLNRLQMAWLDVQLPEQQHEKEHIAAKTLRGIELVPLNDILYFMADNKYVTVHHRHGEVLIDDPLKVLEEDHTHDFVRIHRNALVRRDAIESLSRNDKGHCFLHLKEVPEPLSISRRHVPLIKKIMQSL